jgi:hypothetical protein
MNYMCFGDAVSFDTMFLTNNLEMPFATLIGIDHYDEDITPSHTSQGVEEVQHGCPIHLSYSGDPVQLKLELFSRSRTSLS